MRKSINRYILIFCALFTMVTITSCEDTMLNNMVGDRVYLLKPGLNEVQVYNFDRAVAEVVVVKSGVGQRAVKLKLEVSADILAKYNSANGTAYKQLPESVYSLVNPSLDFVSDGYKSSFEFEIDEQKLLAEQANDPEATFVIPCEVTNLDPGPDDSVKMETILVPKLVEPYISFTRAGFLTDVTSITSTSAEKLHFNNKIEVNYPASTDVEFTLAVPGNSAELIAQYNAQNGTDYVVLPAGALELQANGKITKGVNYGDFTFQILKSKITGADNAPGYGRYILPLKIEQVSQNKIHPTNSTVLIPFDYHE